MTRYRLCPELPDRFQFLRLVCPNGIDGLLERHASSRTSSEYNFQAGNVLKSLYTSSTLFELLRQICQRSSRQAPSR